MKSLRNFWRWLCDQTQSPWLAAFVLLLALCFVAGIGYAVKHATEGVHYVPRKAH